MKAINPYECSNREIGRIFVLFGRNFKQIEGYFRKTDRVQNGSTIDLTSIQSHSVMLLVSCVSVKHKQIIIRQACGKCTSQCGEACTNACECDCTPFPGRHATCRATNKDSENYVIGQ